MKQALIEKYGEARLPRYTSYPTAPKFSAAVNGEIYSDKLAEIKPGTEASIYVHIPFCRSMCWYCGCHTTITKRDEPIHDYIDILHREIDLVSSKISGKLKVRHLHFGGGTPTIMQPQEFRNLIALLRLRFDFVPNTAVAVEIDPRTLKAEMTKTLGDVGVTRASLSVQSFDPVVQRAINRIQTEEQTEKTVIDLRSAGVSEINFDLIYGLPHQTVQSCIETAKAAVTMRPQRFAVFGYAHIPTFKKHQNLIDTQSLPDTAARNDQAEAISSVLGAAGYVRIGLDHYALKNDDMALASQNGTLRRNFQGYTIDSCDTLIGLGASSIGRVGNSYVQNEVAPGQYAQRIATGSLATVKGYHMTVEDRLRAHIIERIMCDFRANISEIGSLYDVDASALLRNNLRLKRLIDDGVVVLNDNTIEVDRQHRFLVRSVAVIFDAYVDNVAQQFSKAI